MLGGTEVEPPSGDVADTVNGVVSVLVVDGVDVVVRVVEALIREPLPSAKTPFGLL